MFQRRVKRIGLVCWAAVLLAGTARADDWPTYNHDPSRSAVTEERLDFPLGVRWRYRPSQPPMPAWPEPGKELHRMDFDYAPQPVICDGLVYFVSSADDTLRALELATGELAWQFTARGPLRFAPSIARGKAYLAGDDGWLYCLESKTGSPVWQFRAAPGDDQVVGNGRMISRWPCRSGAVVADAVVYCSAGMWPSEGVYVYALDADTGRILWCNDSSGDIYIHTPHPGATSFSGVAPQGYLLVYQDTLLVPTGRCVPAAFDRRTGRLLYYRPAEALFHGGAWITAADGLYFNPKNRSQNPSEAFLGEAQPCPRDGMFAYGFASGKPEFELSGAYRVLAAGGMLYAADGQSVQALSISALRKQTKSAAKDILWSTPHAERVYCLALAKETLLAGNSGSITALEATRGKPLWSQKVEGQVRGLAISGGRLVAATQQGTLLCFEPRAASAIVPRGAAEAASPVSPPEEQKKTAGDIVEKSGKSEGYALVIGEHDSSLAEALAGATQLQVLSVLEGTSRIAAERARLLKNGLYGTRVSVQGLEDLSRLPFAPYFADLVVVSGAAQGISPGECYRVLRPCGGTLCFAGLVANEGRAFARAAGVSAEEWIEAKGMVVRGPLPGAGEWRYPWADGGRSGVGKESLVRMPLRVLWFGGPGPDRLMDRHWMGSPPLAVDGRVFMTGEHHVIAFDAYQGRELWSRRLEDAGRKYSQYYSENLVADDQSVYVVTHDQCHRLDQRTGRTTFVYHMPDAVVLQTPPPAAAQYLDIPWPATWQVFGPLDKGKRVPAARDLGLIPERLTVEGETYQASPLEAVGGILDLQALAAADAAPPAQPKKAQPKKAQQGRSRTPATPRRRPGVEPQIAYAFAGIQCPTAGKLLIGAGSDGPMQWYLDGKRIFNNAEDQGRAPRPANAPVSPAEHVFEADVAAGGHVLAVVLESFGAAWRLASASLGRNPKDALPLVTGNANVPNLKNLVWGYLSVADDLLLGSYAVPIAAGQPGESQLICRSESKALFALNKQDGSLRWVYRPGPDRTVSNIEIAFGDGRLFLLDATSKADSVRARRRGEQLDVRLTLVALNLADGSELWRQDDVPVLPDRSMPTRLRSNPSHLFMGLPNWGHLVYADGVVVLGANAAYDAATGRKLWQQEVRPQKLPIVLGNWLIAQPDAYDLRTGRQRMVKDLLSGKECPWSFRRAYGCGPVNGCQNLLFFRSGADGIVDLATRGTANIGGVRPGCSRSITAACGLLIHPEGYSGCCCSYNYQTSLAMVSAPESTDAWYVLPRHVNSGPIRQLAVNFGAPGDRQDSHGTAWLGFPRPISNDACPAPVTVVMDNASCYYRRGATAKITDERPWVYSSGLRGGGQIAVDMVLQPRLAIATRQDAPVLDGLLDDSGWKSTAPVAFENGPLSMLGSNIDLRIFKDAENLYFGYHRKPLPDAPTGVSQDTVRRSDAFEIYLTDQAQRRGLHFGLGRNEETFATLGTVDRYRKVDPTWKGPWRWAIRQSADEWAAEVAVPLELLTRSGIDVRQLQLNCMSQNLTRAGLEAVFLTDPRYGAQFQRCGGFRTIDDRPGRPSKTRSFTVRLHFAEIEDLRPGDRVFDVALQGRTVVNGLDIVREAGGQNRPLVKQFRGVQGDQRIVIELVPRVNPATPGREPVLSGVEIIEEQP